MPSEQRVDATLRNANWVLKYWECTPPAGPFLQQEEGGSPQAARGSSVQVFKGKTRDRVGGEGEEENKPAPAAQVSRDLDMWDYSACFPDPITPEYGFKKSKGRKDAVQWADC